MSALYSIERTPADNTAEKPMKERQLAAYYKALEFVEGARVLEIGCGEGIGASILAGKAATVVALDYSEPTLQAARERYGRPNIEYTQMRVPPIDLEDASFDVVVCFQMIEHLEKPQELLLEIKRVMRGNGVALVATVNKEEMISDNPYHLREFTACELEQLLKTDFASVALYGVYGDELFMRYWENNRKWVRGVLRADVFNLSARLPMRFRRQVYDVANVLMRIFLKRRDPELCAGITHENLIFKLDEFAGCLDFFAVCRRTQP